MTFVLTELSERILTVTLQRPEKLNALNAEVVEELRRVFHEAKANPEVGALILTGTGEKAFVAGADISGFPALTPVAARDFARKGQAVFDLLETMGKPSIAAVNGFALGGGCELAMACSMRVASRTARFGQPEVALGLIPGYGGTQRLPRLVGVQAALPILLEGARLAGQAALDAGAPYALSTAATPVYPCSTPLLVAIFALSLSVRLLLRSVPFGPRRSVGWFASQPRICAASCSRRSTR